MGQRIDSSLDFAQEGTPAAPASGVTSLYAKSDGNLYLLQSAGSEAMVLRAGAAASVTTLTTSDGAVGTPSHSFASQTNTGMYRAATSDLGLAVNGAAMLRVSRANANPSIGFLGNGASSTIGLVTSYTANDSGAGSGATQFGLVQQVQFQPTSEVGNTYYSATFRALLSDVNATGNLVGSVIGLHAASWALTHNRPSTVGNMEALRVDMGSYSNAGVGGTVATAYGVRVNGTKWYQNVTTLYGIAVAVPTVGTATGGSGNAVIATAYGLYLANQNVATTNWAIYSAGGNSSHAGSLRLGDNSAPGSTLDVNGSAAVNSLTIDTRAAGGTGTLTLTGRTGGNAVSTATIRAETTGALTYTAPASTSHSFVVGSTTVGAFTSGGALQVGDLATSRTNLGIASGTANLPFSSSTTSGTVTISHGLGRTPASVVCTAYSAPAFGQIVRLNTYNWSSTQFTVSGEIGTSYNGNIQFSWVAIG